VPDGSTPPESAIKRNLYNPAVRSYAGMRPGHPKPDFDISLNVGNGSENTNANSNANDLQALPSKLTHLRLSNTSMHEFGVAAIAKWLADPDLRVTHLDISRNEVCGSRSSHTFDPETFMKICSILRTLNSSITCLNLSKCDIGARSTRHLMEALKENRGVRTLILDECNCSEEGMYWEAHMLLLTVRLSRSVILCKCVWYGHKNCHFAPMSLRQLNPPFITLNNCLNHIT